MITKKDFKKKEYDYSEKILEFIVGFILTVVLISVILGFIALFLFTIYEALYGAPLLKTLFVNHPAL
jgi:hypothetical protein